MTWLAQNTSRLADAGFAVLIIAVALVLLKPVEPNKRWKRALPLFVIGVIALPLGLWRGMQFLTTTGESLIMVAFFELVQSRIDTGKEKWPAVRPLVLVASVIGAVLIVLSVVGTLSP